MTTVSLALGGVDHVPGLFWHFPYTILPTAPGGRHCHYSHWTDKETEALGARESRPPSSRWLGSAVHSATWIVGSASFKLVNQSLPGFSQHLPGARPCGGWGGSGQRMWVPVVGRDHKQCGVASATAKGYGLL